LQSAAWTYSILPYLEQHSAFFRGDQAIVVKPCLCPSRGRSMPQAVPGDDPVFTGIWYANVGGTNPWGKTDYAGNWYGLVNRGTPDGSPLTGLPRQGGEGCAQPSEPAAGRPRRRLSSW
jgi:hypothetical protein